MSYSNYKLSNGKVITVEEGSNAESTLDNLQTAEKIIENVDSPKKQYTQLSGRFEIDSDGDWASWSDPNFGPSLQDWDLDLGKNSTPNIDWDGQGLLFPKGAILKKITLKVMGNSSNVREIETFARVHDTDLFLNQALDSSGEIGAVDISEANLIIDMSEGSKNGNDMQAFEIPLGDYTFNNVGDLHLYMRSSGSTSGSRQVRCTIFIEWEI